MKTEFFLGHECASLENEFLKLLVTQSIGPRILWFGFRDGENLFAELPDFVTELPIGGVYHFYGGHRLWIAPESFDTTYIPDDSPVDIAPLENGLRITKPVEPQTGIQKSLNIRLTGDTQVIITHQITNYNLQSVTCAPWAITQFKTGGVAILPQTKSDTGVLPNRSLALWSYTDMSNKNVQWGREYILISAQMASPFKVGFSNPRGWLAYWLEGTLFVKHADYNSQVPYYDFGSSSECYCNDQFLELETLGPITSISPNETVTHVETWDLYKDVERPQSEKDVQSLTEKLMLA
ncbi:MAG TPA: hypothetical protein VJM08_07985 [Anaerolineales bacterium]|nr:hypothetical protein [Anaerolineales bacterium]